jgi:hypothetical protein
VARAKCGVLETDCSRTALFRISNSEQTMFEFSHILWCKEKQRNGPTPIRIERYKTRHGPQTCPAARRSSDHQTPSGTEVRSGPDDTGGVGQRPRLGSRSLVPVPDDVSINPVLVVPIQWLWQVASKAR